MNQIFTLWVTPTLKRMALALLFLSTIVVVQAQTARTYTGATNGDWNTAANWTPAGVPAAIDPVTITLGRTVNVSATATAASITFGATPTNNVATVIALGANTLTVSGAISFGSYAGSNNNTFSRITISTGTLNAGSVSFTDIKGQIVFSGAGTMNVTNGNFGSGGTFTASTSTVNFSRSGVQTVGAYTYNNLTFSGSGAKTTTGATVNGVLSMEGTATVTGTAPTYGTAATLQYKGSAAQTTGIEFTTSWAGSGGIKINNASGVTLSAARNINATPLTIGDVVTNSVFSDGGFQLTSTGTLNLTSGTFKLGSATAATTFPAFTARNITAGTTVEYASGVAQTVSTIPAYKILTFSGAGTKTTTSGTLTVGENWNVGSTTQLNTNNTAVNLTGNLTGTGAITQGAGLITVGGDWTNTGAFSASSAGVILTGTGNQITGASGLTFTTLTVNGSYTNNNPSTLTISTALAGTGTLTQGTTNATLNLAGAVTIASLDATATGNTVIFSSNSAQTIPNGSYYNITSSGSGSRSLGAGAINIAGAFITGTNTFTTPTSGTVTFSGANQTIPFLTFYNLATTGSGTKTLGATITVNNNLTIGNGTTLDASATPYDLIVKGNWTNNGTFAPQTGTVILNGSTLQTISGSTTAFNNLTVSNTTTPTSVATTVDITVANTLTINANSVFVPGAANTISGTGKLAGTGTIHVTQIGATNGLFTQYPIYIGNTAAIESLSVNYSGAGTQQVDVISYGNLTTSGSGTKTVGGTGALKVSGNLSVLNPTTLDIGDYTAEALEQGTTSTLLLENGATLRVGGSHKLPTNFNTYTLQPTSTVNFYGGSSSNHFILARTYGNLTLSDNTTVTATENITVVGTLTIGTGTTFSATNSSSNLLTHNIQGTWTNNGTFAASTSTINFNGTTAQTIGGSSSTNFENLSINNSNGITISKTALIDANGVVNFGTGLITTTATNLLVFNDNADYTGVSNTSFVNGPVQKIGNDGFKFPVGKSGIYAPISIAGGGAVTDAFTAEYIRASATALDSDKTAPLEAVSNCEYWNLTRAAGSRDTRVTLFWSTDSDCGSTYITNAATLVVAHLPSGATAWESHGGTAASGSDGTSGSIVTPAVVTDFSPFTIGTTNAALNPLPVTFVSFKGKKVGNSTQLSWKVGGEVNVTGYEVERRTGNGQFAKIGYVTATGSSDYAFTDATPQIGVVFYRIKNIDVDGKSTYSTLVIMKNGTGIQVFPTVVTSKTTILHDAAGTGALLSVSAADGRQVKLQRAAAGSMQTDVDLSGLRPGLYLLKWNDGPGNTETVKLVKK